ncbi:MAG: hypothetical protein F4Y63_07915 [Chloroflexi bacterium]|nr:hypothetical protein [Chloroflexota bacterium]MYF78612.1 hypothetical protein [Chloroflexota bacterium]
MTNLRTHHKSVAILQNGMTVNGQPDRAHAESLAAVEAPDSEFIFLASTTRCHQGRQPLPNDTELR